jgi:hypothetical protein
MYGTAPWLRRLFAGLWRRTPPFHLRLLRVGRVVDTGGNGKDFIPSPSVLACQYHSTNDPHSFVHYHRCYMTSKPEGGINNTPKNWIHTCKLIRVHSTTLSVFNMVQCRIKEWIMNWKLVKGNAPDLTLCRYYSVFLKTTKTVTDFSHGPSILYGSSKFQTMVVPIQPRCVVATAFPLRVW